jgi:hypothetical protein
LRPASYYHRSFPSAVLQRQITPAITTQSFFPASKFNPRRSAIRNVRVPAPSWKKIVNSFFGRSLEGVAQKACGVVEHARSITILPTRSTTSYDKADVNSPPASPSIVASTTVNTNAAVNWLYHAHFPRELRNKIYDYTLPSDITIHNGVVTSEVGKLLSIDRRSRREFLEQMRLTHHHTLEYTSGTALVHSLTSLPAGSFAPYRHLTITVVGAYNGHSNTYGGNGFHRTNIAPTLLREADKISFEIEFACSDCWTEDFPRRELWFRLPLVLRGFVRVSAEGVRVRTNVRWRRLSGTAPLMPSYDENVSYAAGSAFRFGAKIADLSRRSGSRGNLSFRPG